MWHEVTVSHSARQHLFTFSGLNSSLENTIYHTALTVGLGRNPIVFPLLTQFTLHQVLRRCCIALHVNKEWLDFKYKTVGLTHLPCTIVVFSTPSGSTTVSSNSCSSRFSFCSMVVCVNAGAQDDTYGPCTTAGGRGALFLDDLL